MKDKGLFQASIKHSREKMSFKGIRVYWLGILIMAMLIFPCPTRADVAPPRQPPGVSPETKNPTTQVQMVAEEVIIEVRERTKPLPTPSGNTADFCSATVEASFRLRNQGKDKETMAVWFPLGVESGFGSANTIQNFRGWVGENEAEIVLTDTPSSWGAPIPSASWQVSFPPSEEVMLRVIYELNPEGYPPFGAFSYLLETGAGWYGSIQKAVVIVRLPYEVNEYNTVLDGELYSLQPKNYTIEGNEIIWRFENFEPSPADNIAFTVLAPSIWKEILRAKEQAAEKPEDPTAHLALARSLERALQFKYQLIPIGRSAELDRQAEEAYQTALSLDPQSITLHKEYLAFLNRHWFSYSGSPPPAQLILALGKALEVAPRDQDLLRYKEEIENAGFTFEKLLIEARQTASALPSATATDQPTRAWTATAPYPPTQTVTIPSTATIPLPTATLSPAPTENAEKTPSSVPCWGSLLILLLPVGLIVLRSKRQDD